LEGCETSRKLLLGQGLLALRTEGRAWAGIVLAVVVPVEAVLVTHQNESVLVFLPVLSALLPAVRDHFVPVAFAVGLCSGLELLLLLERQGPPSLSDELAEFLKVVLLGRLGGRGLGEAALSCLPKIEIVGRKRALGRRASVEILGFDL